jgi:hypothetical protein
MDESIKYQTISEFKDLEALAYAKRLEYLTIDILPECEFKRLKLEKLAQEEQALMLQFNNLMTELLVNY